MINADFKYFIIFFEYENKEVSEVKKCILIVLFVLAILILSPVISCADKVNSDYWKEIKPGDELIFGRFMQNEDGLDLTPVEWVVLERKKNQITVLSIKNLEALPFHDVFGGAYWSKCSLRKWLNNEFLNTAFTREEQNAIVSASRKCRVLRTSKTISSKEKVFLLSDSEAARYFCTKHSYAGNVLAEWDASDYEFVDLTKGYYRAYDTAYANRVIKYSSLKLSDDSTKRWWTRTPDYSEFYPTVTGSTDTNFRIDWESCTDGYGVRPAIVIDLNKIKNSDLLEIKKKTK